MACRVNFRWPPSGAPSIIPPKLLKDLNPFSLEVPGHFPRTQLDVFAFGVSLFYTFFGTTLKNTVPTTPRPCMLQSSCLHNNNTGFTNTFAEAYLVRYQSALVPQLDALKAKCNSDTLMQVYEVIVRLCDFSPLKPSRKGASPKPSRPWMTYCGATCLKTAILWTLRLPRLSKTRTPLKRGR